MALKVMDVVELRLRVIADCQSGMSVREVAARHGVGKTQVYEWLRRHRVEGAAGLAPRSRRPLVSPRQLDAAVEDTIVVWRKDRPRWGAKKIRAMLRRDGVRLGDGSTRSLTSLGLSLPSVSTVHQVLVRRGLVDQVARRREPPGGWRRFVRPCCNDLWHVDATRHLLANGRAFWVIDLIDDHSRFLIATHVCPAPTVSAGWAAVRSAVAQYGLPRQMLSDNGLNFTGRLRGVTVAFERQVRAAGIELIHARPYHPETLGKLERQHATQNDWLADWGAPASLAAAQRLLETYREDYNTARPHEAIGQLFPAEIYRPDDGIDLPVLDIEPADTYPAGALMRRVGVGGWFSYAGTKLQIDNRWAGIPVGLLREHGQLHVHYGTARIETLIVSDLPEPTPRGRRPRNKT